MVGTIFINVYMCNVVTYYFLPVLLWYLFQDLSPTALINPRRTLSTEKKK